MSSRNLFPIDPRGLEDIATQLLNGTSPSPAEPEPSPNTGIVQLSDDNFYKFPRSFLQSSLPIEYRIFLKNAGWADLDSASHLGIAKSMLRINANVRKAAEGSDLIVQGNEGDYLVSINHPQARHVTMRMGGKILPTGIMYNLFIPYLKAEKAKGDTQAAETLKEMIEKKAEWMEDVIKDVNTLCIGRARKILSIPTANGLYFNKGDLNIYGYPIVTNNQLG